MAEQSLSDLRTAASSSRPAAARPDAGIDPSVRFVRAVHERPDGFVEFEFCVGDEQLCVELVLPRAAYREFCRHHHVAYR